MQFDLSWLSDPTVFQVGTLPPVSDHEVYADQAEAEAGQSSLKRSLDGTWLAHFALNPSQAPEALLLSDEMDGQLREIMVPGEFQLQNPDWDPPHYVNVQYPWDGHERLVPPQVSTGYNPTVTAVRHFSLTEKECAAARIVLTFEAVEAALALWVNGRFVGYAEDSFTPHAFDIKPFVHPGDNRIAARVFKRCTGSWVEDQDFWRFSGIHRSVTLFFQPETHLRDVFVTTPWAEGCFSLKVDPVFEGSVSSLGLRLEDSEGQTVYETSLACEGTVSHSCPLSGVRPWSAEEPNLYTLTLTLTGPSGEAETCRLEVGFRRFEMVDGVMCINGKRIVFHGVNRHEFDCDLGRVMTRELLERDIRDMKGMNVNAVRTCHYPNTSLFYRLCDRYGLYVIDETNIESHGTWARGGKLEQVVPGDRPDWQELILARGRAMQERDKNHACVLLWSCGNESFGGRDLFELSEMFRRRDPGRLVHYEGVANDQRYPDTTDVYSRMYAKVADIEKYLQTKPAKPFMNCEYTHAMGNSCGGIGLYADLEDSYPQYQGGFIWDYVDQALRVKGPNGQTRLAYGSDFGDRPTDWHFNTNGIVLGDRTLTPKCQEVRQVFSPIRLTPDENGVTVDNRRLFAPLRNLSLRWEALRLSDGAVPGTGELPCPEVPAGEKAYVSIPFPASDGAEIALTVRLLVADDPLLPAGHELCFGQTVVGEPARRELSAPVPLIECDSNIGFRGKENAGMISRLDGLISFRDAAGKETLLRAPLLSLFRAPTDNDRGNKDALRQGIWHQISRYSAQNPAQVTEDGAVCFRYDNPLLPDLDLSLTVIPREEETEFVLAYGGVRGQSDLPAFGLSFLLDHRLQHVEALCKGPDENYVDRDRGARLGWWRWEADEGMTRYCKPQESGSHRGLRLLRLTDDSGHGLLLTGDGLEVSVLPWLPEQLASVYHPDELAGPTRTVMDVALFRKGVGGDDSWGAPVLPQFTYPSDQPRVLRFTLKGI
ncbi:MAG: DUF4981 domain-containing protein [Clostridia bacterium]|nr:DUF4981 domain-containing protein [Clostridia bacterium]